MPDPYDPIACHLHDYLEIACSHRYRLHVELVGGGSIEGVALTTESTSSKEEFLVLLRGSEYLRLRLDQLQAITPMDSNSAFGRVVLRAPDAD